MTPPADDTKPDRNESGSGAVPTIVPTSVKTAQVMDKPSEQVA